MSIDGEWIKARLTGKRGEKAALARALGILDADVSKILSGHRRVQPNEIDAVLAFFGEAPLTDRERLLLEMFRQADPTRQKVIEDILSAAQEG